jgi:hypothetical protein
MALQEELFQIESSLWTNDAGTGYLEGEQDLWKPWK